MTRRAGTAMLGQLSHLRKRAMATQIKAYPIVERAINLFGDWLKRGREISELREINSGDFARIAQGLCVTCHCRKLNPASKWSRIG
jgi:hypothetical protein